MDDILTIREVAALKDVNVQTVYNAIRAGKLTPTGTPGMLGITRADAEAWVGRTRRKPTLSDPEVQPPWSRMVSAAEAEILQIAEDNPDKFCFIATFVNNQGDFEELIGLWVWFPNCRVSFEHFHVAWSILHNNYLAIPGCFLHDWKKDDLTEVERFTEPQPAYEWLLEPGVELRQKGMLPDGRPVRVRTDVKPGAATDERIQRIEVGPSVPVVPTEPTPQRPPPVPGQYELIAMRRRGMSTGSIAAYYGISKEEVLSLLLQRT